MQPVSPTHRPLNTKQLVILRLLYRFRFATTLLLARSLAPNTIIKINRRLATLVEQGYMGRNFDPSYFATRRPATYYLATAGIHALRALPGTTYSRRVLKTLGKDKDASAPFIARSLKLFDLTCSLQEQSGANVRYFTKSELADFPYFPEPKPDAYLRLATSGLEQQHFIELLSAYRPFSANVGTIKKYLDYLENSDWTEVTRTPFPTIVLICDSRAQQRSLVRYPASELYGFDPDSGEIIITTIPGFLRLLGAKI